MLRNDMLEVCVRACWLILLVALLTNGWFENGWLVSTKTWLTSGLNSRDCQGKFRSYKRRSLRVANRVKELLGFKKGRDQDQK